MAAEDARVLGSRLEQLLKRIQPMDWTQTVALRIKEIAGKPDLMRFSPPHFLLHSIEANMAYHRKAYREPVTERQFAEVMNTYLNRTDPLQAYLAGTEISHFGIAITREQLEWQVHVTREHFSRYWRLFHDASIPTLSRALLTRYGMTPMQWIQTAFAAYLNTHNDPHSRLNKAEFIAFGEQHLHAAPAEFLRHSSRTPSQIAAHYRESRTTTKPQFHSIIRSVFLEAPLIDFGEDRYLAPMPQLLLRHATSGLHRLLKDLPVFKGAAAEEFGDSVERYVGELLACAELKTQLRDKRSLENSGFKSCDFLMTFSDSTLLVEAKATTMQVQRLIEDNLRNDGSTRAVIDGMEQLSVTASKVKAGDFEPLGVRRDLPVYAVVATYGDNVRAKLSSVWRHSHEIQFRQGDQPAFAIGDRVFHELFNLIIYHGVISALRRA